jgi:hypothetical protein
MKRHLSRARNDSGSIAPLGIGLFLFIFAMMFTIVSASSMFIFQKRLTTVAEAAAVYISSGGESSVFNEFVTQQGFTNLRLKDELLIDGLTSEVVACALWLPPVPTLEPLGSKEVCSHASARAGD